jgi:CubicO group peptidase (beta-lactamase class C family)
VRELGALVAEAGFPATTPIALAICDMDGTIGMAAAGQWPSGRTVGTSDLFYVASLAKQLTGAAAALLVRNGRLDPDAPVSLYQPELPAWAANITPRQLAHHTAGLPEASILEKQTGSGHWTSDFVLSALQNISVLPHQPLMAHIYSNAGYVLLARIVERISGQSFADFAETQMFVPNGISGMRYVTSADASLPQQAMLGSTLPLAVGDGGLWSSAPAFARWLHLMNRDALNIEEIVASDARLSDGTPVGCGWGIGLRVRNGERLYLHSGSWSGAIARAAQLPERGIGVVAMAGSDDEEALAMLVEDTLVELTGPVDGMTTRTSAR